MVVLRVEEAAVLSGAAQLTADMEAWWIPCLGVRKAAAELNARGAMPARLLALCLERTHKVEHLLLGSLRNKFNKERSNFVEPFFFSFKKNPPKFLQVHNRQPASSQSGGQSQQGVSEYSLRF